MRTMFTTQDNNGKKSFQKPNILRKRTKVTSKPNVSLPQESLNVSGCVTSMIAPETQSEVESSMKVTYEQNLTKNPIQKVILSNDVSEDMFEITESDGMQGFLLGNNILINKNEENLATSVNVESFLNNSIPLGSISLQEIQTDLRNTRVKEQWCLDFMNNAQEIIIEDVDGSQLGSLCVTTAPTVASVPIEMEPSQESSDVSTPVPVQNISFEYIAGNTMNFKCDISDCKKRFRSAKALDKHKLAHESGPKVVRQVTLECPVQKVSSDGVGDPCGTLCTSKEELVRHLNENHSPQDAMYICAECGRRFFWASGLRAHARSHCAGGARRAPLVCEWDGCGRAFRQPCRLREHMRAHTGDRPYPCLYPNCGWSFRTASKLMRHALRHTGERRHSCAQCGRAFRRREHLRDHHARHHRDQRTGCKKKLVNMDSLESPSDGEADPPPACLSPPPPSPPPASTPALLHFPESAPLETFMISLDSPPLSEAMPESEVVPLVAGDTAPILGVEACHAARTHCTWPLEPRAPPEPEPQPEQNEEWNFVDAEYVLEEDVQVEMSEGSESNIYTIRSDLFLHGNILNNEDSEQMSGGGEGGAGDQLATAEPELSLLDAHPTIDLMQEELMYTDSAVDESSFRVFLLSEELS